MPSQVPPPDEELTTIGPEPKLALRLLCEAWRLGKGKLNCVEITCPTTAREWRKPFGDSAANDSIAAQMGADEAKARCLLQAVDSGDDRAIDVAIGKLFPALASKASGISTSAPLP